MSKNTKNANNKFKRKEAQKTQKEVRKKQKQQTIERKHTFTPDDRSANIKFQKNVWNLANYIYSGKNSNYPYLLAFISLLSNHPSFAFISLLLNVPRVNANNSANIVLSTDKLEQKCTFTHINPINSFFKPEPICTMQEDVERIEKIKKTQSDVLNNLSINIGSQAINSRALPPGSQPRPLHSNKNREEEIKKMTLKVVQKEIHKILEKNQKLILSTTSLKTKLTINIIEDIPGFSAHYTPSIDEITFSGLPPDSKKYPLEFKEWSECFHLYLTHELMHRFHSLINLKNGQKVTETIALPVYDTETKKIENLYKQTLKEYEKLLKGNFSEKQKILIRKNFIPIRSKSIVSKEQQNMYKWQVNKDMFGKLITGMYPTNEKNEHYVLINHYISKETLEKRKKTGSLDKVDVFLDIMGRWLDLFNNGNQYSKNKEVFLSEMAAILSQLGSVLSKEFFPTLNAEQTKRINAIYEENVIGKNLQSEIYSTPTLKSKMDTAP